MVVVALVLARLMKVASCAHLLHRRCCPSIDTLVHIRGTLSIQGRALLMERGEGRGGYMHTSPFGSEQPQVCAAHRVDVSEVQPALVQGVNVADASLKNIIVCH